MATRSDLDTNFTSSFRETVPLNAAESLGLGGLMLLQHGPELVDVEVDCWAGSTVWIDGTALGFNFIWLALFNRILCAIKSLAL